MLTGSLNFAAGDNDGCDDAEDFEWSLFLDPILVNLKESKPTNPQRLALTAKLQN